MKELHFRTSGFPKKLELNRINAISRVDDERRILAIGSERTNWPASHRC